jgi:hypothetical protein
MVFASLILAALELDRVDGRLDATTGTAAQSQILPTAYLKAHGFEVRPGRRQHPHVGPSDVFILSPTYYETHPTIKGYPAKLNVSIKGFSTLSTWHIDRRFGGDFLFLPQGGYKPGLTSGLPLGGEAESTSGKNSVGALAKTAYSYQFMAVVPPGLTSEAGFYEAGELDKSQLKIVV